MKNNKLRASLAALMLLAVSTVFAEPIKLDDVKVGSTVTRDGISFGWGDHLPVPEGEWEVVVREDAEVKGNGPFEHTPTIYLTLLNRNKNSELKLLQVKTYLGFKNRMSPNISCPTSNWVLKSDRVGTTEGQNFQLCKAIYKPKSYKSLFEWRESRSTTLKKWEVDFVNMQFNENDPIFTTLLLSGGQTGNYPLTYLIGVEKNLDISILENWLQANIFKIKDHYDGKQVVFTDLLK